MMKGDKMAKRSSFGSIVRKRFSDITNSLPQSKSPAIVKTMAPDSSSNKDLEDNLVKENLALVKLIQDKNKVIEMNGLELQKYRINLQKVQLQNWNLAQANSHMMAELNFGKEKLKSLQHELSCMEALLKAKIEELKKGEAIPVDMNANNEDGRLTNCTRRRCFTRSRSIGQAITNQQGVEKDAAENKRRCLRRQSVGSKIHQVETTDDMFEIDSTSSTTDSMASKTWTRVDRPNASPYISKAGKVQKDGFGFKTKQPERSSIGRPSRRAAEKVQSYKEIPVNLKMRRND